MARVNYVATINKKSLTNSKVCEMMFRTAITTLGLDPHGAGVQFTTIGKIEEMQDRIATGSGVGKPLKSNGSVDTIKKALLTNDNESIRTLVQDDKIGLLDIYPIIDKEKYLEDIIKSSKGKINRETARTALYGGFIEAILKTAITGAILADKRSEGVIQLERGLKTALRKLKQFEKDVEDALEEK